MRSLIALFAVFSALPLAAQDASQLAIQQAQMANQQAIQAAQQANQQAMQAAQLANQQAMQANQQAMQDAQNAQTLACCRVAAPKLSVKAGTYTSPVTLRLKDSTRGTVIYYTTDGWTPTPLSTRYTGPITISSTTTLQAIAVTANNWRSPILSAVYAISGSSSEPVVTSFPANAPGSPVLLAGTVLPLVFTAGVSSHDLEVGDRLPVALAQDLAVGGVVVAAKNTPVLATVIQVDNSGRMGLPGTLSFAVHSLPLKDGTVLPLSATETKEGRSRVGTAGAASIIPLGGLFVRGENAEIASGATLTAVVAPDANNQAKVAANDPNFKAQ